MRVFFLLLFVFVNSVVAMGQEVTDAVTLQEKIKAFDDFELSKKNYDKSRDQGLNELLDERKLAQKQRQKELEDYLKEKAKEKKVKPEDTPAYESYLLQKWEWRSQLDKAASVELQKKRNFSRDKKALTFELREYGLLDSETHRVPYNKRKLFGTKSSSGSGGSFGGGYGGGTIPPYIPPPAEEIPDFSDDIPPPPPPPPMPGPGEFEEFDPGAYQPPPPPPPPPPME